MFKNRFLRLAVTIVIDVVFIILVSLIDLLIEFDMWAFGIIISAIFGLINQILLDVLEGSISDNVFFEKLKKIVFYLSYVIFAFISCGVSVTVLGEERDYVLKFVEKVACITPEITFLFTTVGCVAMSNFIYDRKWQCFIVPISAVASFLLSLILLAFGTTTCKVILIVLVIVFTIAMIIYLMFFGFLYPTETEFMAYAGYTSNSSLNKNSSNVSSNNSLNNYSNSCSNSSYSDKVGYDTYLYLKLNDLCSRYSGSKTGYWDNDVYIFIDVSIGKDRIIFSIDASYSVDNETQRNNMVRQCRDTAKNEADNTARNIRSAAKEIVSNLASKYGVNRSYSIDARINVRQR